MYVLEIERFVDDPHGHEDTPPLEIHWELVGLYSAESLVDHFNNGMPFPENPYSKRFKVISLFTQSPGVGMAYTGQNVYRIRHTSYW